MRPNAIVQFERLYLVSLALVVVQQVVAFFLVRNVLDGFTAGMGGAPEIGGTFSVFMIFAMLFGLVLSVGLPLLFWWLAARKRQEFAKWVLLVLSVLSGFNWLLSVSVLFFLPSNMTDVPGLGGLQGAQGAIVAIDLVAEVLGIIALTYLFRHEAVAWFRSAGPTASADVFR